MANWVQRLDFTTNDFLVSGPAAAGAISINPASPAVAQAVAAGVSTAIATATATVPDLLTGGASTGKVVTDAVLRVAFGTGQFRHIYVAGDYAQALLTAVQTGALDGLGVYGEVAGSGNGAGIEGVVSGSGSGPAVRAYYTGSGSGPALETTYIGSGSGKAASIVHNGSSAVSTGDALDVRIDGATQGSVIFARHTGAGNGSTIVARNYSTGSGHAVDAYQIGTGAGIAGLFVDTGGAARSTVVQVNRVNAAQTTWCLEANGPIFAAGGFTTSDQRLKFNVAEIEGKRAAEFAASVKWYTFDKLTDPSTVARVEAEVRGAGATEVAQLNLKLADEALPKEKRDALVAALSAAKGRAAFSVDMSVTAQLVGRQAGVIAQELQALTAKAFPEYAFLVVNTVKGDPNSTLVVDYTSLQAIINRGVQFKLFGA